MNQDEQHLNLLSTFHYVVGGLTLLISCVFLMNIGIGIAMLCGVFDGKEELPRFIAWFNILFPAVYIIVGWTLAGFIIAAGRKLKHHTSHKFCLIVAGCECILTPFGTVLGVFTIIVLMKDSVKELFSANQAAELTP